MDPIPTSNLKQCLETLGDQITSIIICSLSQSIYKEIYSDTFQKKEFT